MKWIKSWSKIDEEKTYLVCARYGGLFVKLYQPQLLKGWEVKRLMEGTYLATEFIPPAGLGECE